VSRRNWLWSQAVDSNKNIGAIVRMQFTVNCGDNDVYRIESSNWLRSQ